MCKTKNSTRNTTHTKSTEYGIHKFPVPTKNDLNVCRRDVELSANKQKKKFKIKIRALIHQPWQIRCYVLEPVLAHVGDLRADEFKSL